MKMTASKQILLPVCAVLVHWISGGEGQGACCVAPCGTDCQPIGSICSSEAACTNSSSCSNLVWCNESFPGTFSPTAPPKLPQLLCPPGTEWTAPLPPYVPSDEVVAFSGGTTFTLNCDNGKCEPPSLHDPWVYTALSRVAVFLFFASLCLCCLCTESCCASCAEDKKKRASLSEDDDDDNDMLITQQRPRGSCCCPYTWRRPYRFPSDNSSAWLTIAAAICCLGVIYTGYLSIKEVWKLDNSFKTMADDLNVIGTWFDDLSLATDNVTNHTVVLQWSINYAVLNSGVPVSSNATLDGFVESLNSTIIAVRDANYATNNLAATMTGNLNNLANEIKNYIDEYDGYWRNGMLAIVAIIGVFVLINVAGTVWHGIITSCTHNAKYHCWRNFYTPFIICLMVLLLILGTLYFAATVGIASVCANPTETVLDISKHIKVNNSNLADNVERIKIAIPAVNGLGFVPTTDGTTFLASCNNYQNIGGPCFMLDNIFTVGQLIKFYFSCSEKCMVMPLRQTELFLTGMLFDTANTLIGALTESADSVLGGDDWKRVSKNFAETLDAFSGGSIKTTGSQPYGVLGLFSCKKINGRITKVLDSLCNSVFPQMELLFVAMVAMLVLMIGLELSLRGIMWDSDPAYMPLQAADDPFLRTKDGAAIQINPAYDPDGTDV